MPATTPPSGTVTGWSSPPHTTCAPSCAPGQKPGRPWTSPPTASETAGQAKEIIDRQVTAIQDSWDQAADEARLTRDERGYLWGRQILNRYALSNYS